MRGDTARLPGNFVPVDPHQEGVALAGPPNHSRSGSETRQRTVDLHIRLTPEERAQINAHAERAGLTSGSYARLVLLGTRSPRQVRRPPVERAELGRLLGAIGHVGANLNQLAHASNSGLPVGRRELAEALAGLAKVRDAILSALGRGTPVRRSPEDEAG